MVDTNARHIPVGEKFFDEVHSVNPQLCGIGVVKGDILLCEHTAVSQDKYGFIEVVATRIWTHQDNTPYEYNHHSAEKPYGWLVYSGRPNGKGFISDMWKQKALEFLGGKWGINIETLLQSSERRLILSKRMNEQKLKCPECDTRQVQLIGYINISPAQWRCRHCKHKFEWEEE